jgi:hypothetical protein
VGEGVFRRVEAKDGFVRVGVAVFGEFVKGRSEILGKVAMVKA